jgi:hypothetical protein
MRKLRDAFACRQQVSLEHALSVYALFVPAKFPGMPSEDVLVDRVSELIRQVEERRLNVVALSTV